MIVFTARKVLYQPAYFFNYVFFVQSRAVNQEQLAKLSCRETIGTRRMLLADGLVELYHTHRLIDRNLYLYRGK